MAYAPEEMVEDLSLAAEARGLCVTTLIREHHTGLLQFLRRRLRRREDAADVAQETYVRMLQYEGSSQIRSPGSLLYRVAINVANDLGRSELARGGGNSSSLDDQELVSPEPSPERSLAAQQDLNVLLAVIEGLPPRCRQVFLLSRVHELSYPQIAERCGISVKMVEKHISHALAICLSKVGGS